MERGRGTGKEEEEQGKKRNREGGIGIWNEEARGRRKNREEENRDGGRGTGKGEEEHGTGKRNRECISAPFPTIVQHFLTGHRCVAMLYSLQLVQRDDTRAYPAVVCKQASKRTHIQPTRMTASE